MFPLHLTSRAFLVFFFFFSSRRRHTRWPRDWSSDVCSSDLCGMDLVPVQPELSAEDKTYNTLRKKFWVALAFTFPIFIIAMSEMIPDNPLYNVMSQKAWKWVQFFLSLPDWNSVV